MKCVRKKFNSIDDIKVWGLKLAYSGLGSMTKEKKRLLSILKSRRKGF